MNLNGAGSSADVVSRSVARDDSYQKFDAKIVGNAPCSGHTECDSIIMDRGRILAVPGLEANDVDAALVHEAAIGKIAGRAAHQADDPGPDRAGGRGADHQRVFEIGNRE